ncbi:E1-E2 ATPase-domain-containing protein [Coemansia spiralis]|nr:E1-E2 ATPase-domain-containing protein [Coemansia spiralis]
MARLCYLVLATAVSLLAPAAGFPAFNTPNSIDVHGNACPLLDRTGLTCPTLCVRDIDDCPAALKPGLCPPGKQLCDDATCQASCDGIENPCLCGTPASSISIAYRACAQYATTVTVPQYDPSIKEEQLEYACAFAWELTASNATADRLGSTGVGDWSTNATDARIWAVCPTPQDPKMTFTESYCVAFYAIVGAEVVLYMLWHMYKSMRERHAWSLHQICSPLPAPIAVDSAAEKSAADGDSVAKLVVEKAGSVQPSIDTNASGEDPAKHIPSGTMLLRGYDRNGFGMLLYYLALLSTAGWVVLLAIIVSDYYGAVKGGVAYGLLANSNTSMAVFIFVWHLGGIWMITMMACMHRLRNYFRIACPLPVASVVQIDERREEVVMMEGTHNRLTQLVSRVRQTLMRRWGLDIVTESCPIRREVADKAGYSYIEYHCTRYVLREDTGQFQCNSFELGQTHSALLANRSGLSAVEARNRAAQLGENFIRVAEVFSYFYLYQMMCMWVWFYFNYYKMALVQFGVIIISAFIKVAIRVRSELKVKSLAEHKSECRVRRDGQWAAVNTAELVPGDVVAVESGMEIMCDGCVIRGEVVVDESSLTGEAMPVRKLPLKSDDIAFDSKGSGKIYSVFAGTRVLQCTGSTAQSQSQSQSTLALELGGTNKPKESESSRDSDEPQTQVLVLRTRTATDKGKLIQRILFPTRYSFVFDEQLPVALLILLTYGGFGFALTIWLMGHDVTSWFYGVFVISEIMSPLLPAALVVGQSVAAQRLRRQNIYCVDLPRIMMAGKVQVFCFDKTGTLTKEGLEYFAVQAVQHSVFSSEEKDMARLPSIAQIGFASCHAVTMVSGELIGNPVDVEQFRATDWEIAGRGDDESSLYLDTLVSPFLEPADCSDSQAELVRRRVHVVKRFEFVHARQSMSVAVMDAVTGHVHVFVKGSFERLKRMALAESIPGDYDAVTARWAKEGCYVLAMAHRDLGRVDDLAAVLRMSREQLESGCSLVSLLLFRNQLKEDTRSAIMELKGGDTRTVMITGDTALTGVYIARQCGMVSPTARVLLGSMEAADGKEQLVWRDTATDAVVDNIDMLLHEECCAHEAAEHQLGDVVAKRTPLVELAVTAAAFDYLVAADLARRYLLDIRIFARMTPQGKVQCVNLHMERAVTAMAAHASIVSPFSSSNRSIHSCVTLLREGRSGLATSIAGMLEIVQFYFSVIVPQAVWIMVDSFIAVGLCIAVTQARTARRLAPSRPTARLIGLHTLASVWGQTVINYAFLQSWFRCHDLWWLLGDNYEAEIISIVCLFQFVNGAGVYNFGYRYRRPWATNYILATLYCGFMAVISVLVLANPNRLGCLVLVGLGYNRPGWSISLYNSPNGHNVLPHRFRWTLWGLCVANVRLVVLGPVGQVAKRWWLKLKL